MSLLHIAAQWIGAGAAICSTVSFAPQVLKLIRERDSEAVSLKMYVLTVTAFVLWTLYGVALSSWQLIAANLACLGLSSAVLVLKVRYSRPR